MPYIRNRFIRNAVITSDKLVAGTIVAASLADNILTSSKVANTAYGAGAGTAQNVTPGMPVTLALTIADAATANYDFVLPFKCQAIDAYTVQVGAGNAGNSCTLKNNAGTTFSSALNNATDTGIARTSVLVTTANTFAAGEKMTAAVVKAGGSAGLVVYVTLLRLA